jgi:hypothetical protein
LKIQGFGLFQEGRKGHIVNLLSFITFFIVKMGKLGLMRLALFSPLLSSPPSMCFKDQTVFNRSSNAKKAKKYLMKNVGH